MNIILMSEPSIHQKWAYPVLKNSIHKEDKVCILAFTFFDDIKNQKDWNRQYQKGMGLDYHLIIDMFKRYGIQESQIEWVSYFEDDISTMITKIENSTLLCIPGGAPDLCMKRIKEKKLKKVLKQYNKTILGISAGAMVLLEKYHISPDRDYPDYKECTGLNKVSGFDIEVHFTNNKSQQESIQKKKGILYGIKDDGGILIKDDQLSFMGNVEIFK